MGPLMASPLKKSRRPRNIVHNLFAHAFCKSPDPVGMSGFEGEAGAPRGTAGLRVAPEGAQDWKLDLGTHRKEGSGHVGHPCLGSELVSSQPKDLSPHFVTLLPFSCTQNTLLTQGYTRHQQGQNIITLY